MFVAAEALDPKSPRLVADRHTADLPEDFRETIYASGAYRPSAMAFAPDGRLFLAERRGPQEVQRGDDNRAPVTLRVIKDGVLLPEPFLTVQATTVMVEQGLIGVAVDPAFEVNGYVYVFYTYSGGEEESGFNRLSRFTASDDNPDIADPNSELILLDDIPSGPYHNGGALHFGLDGKLYFGVGDTSIRPSAQSLESLNGVIGRIDPANYPDLVPSDNPFADTPGARPEIWAFGLRNPFTFAVDPETGKIFVNVVGEFAWEWIVELSAGANYGWPICEGPVVLGSTDPCANPEFTEPIFWYPHLSNALAETAELSGCGVIGGAFYRGDQFPAEYHGDYFFTDHCGQWIARMTPDGAVHTFATGTDQWATALTVGPDGSLYYASYISGQVYRIEYTGDVPTASTPAIEPTSSEPAGLDAREATPATDESPPVTRTPLLAEEPTPTPTEPLVLGGGGCTPRVPSASARHLDIGWIALVLLPPALALFRGRR